MSDYAVALLVVAALLLAAYAVRSGGGWENLTHEGLSHEGLSHEGFDHLGPSRYSPPRGCGKGCWPSSASMPAIETDSVLTANYCQHRRIQN